jgi:hypothetical protein
MKYRPTVEDQIVYSDEKYFVVWKDYQQKNFEIYHQGSMEFMFSFFESYVHNFGAAVTTAEDTIAEIEGVDE